MPRVIATDVDAAITIDELIETIETVQVDPRDEASMETLGPALAKLAANRTFLADLAIVELERGFSSSFADGYGAQVQLLARPRPGYLLRANFWPARNDAVVRASGTDAFFYDHAHDHNFPFLTVGYLGPGYWSDYYEVDGERDACVGEVVPMRFIERSRLDPGKTMLYRAHRDVHVQLPPESFSVSLNILFYDPAQVWRSQYRYDVARSTVTEVLTTAPSEALVALATHFGGEAGCALAADMAQRHPVARMRATAAAALRGSAPEWCEPV